MIIGRRSIPKKILMVVIIGLLGYGFWISPDFKQIAAGVAIFLFGMLTLEEGFKTFTGGILEKLLRATTDKLWKSFGVGIFFTAVIQSSSLVSIITISFISSGLIGLAAGIGIIFGANLGTTTGAWLVAAFGLKIKISAYAMPMLVFGVMGMFQKNHTLKGIGHILAGIGFLFLGIQYMKDGFDAFKDTIQLTEFAVGGMPGLLLFTAIGTAVTVILQSSHATLVLIITALAAGQVTYDNGLALAIGANLGTTITAIIGSLSANTAGKRLALAHVIFNVITALIAIISMPLLMQSVDALSVWFGIDSDNYMLKLAVFHTIFNLIGVLVMLPWVDKLVHFLTRQIRDVISPVSQPKYLHAVNIDFPDTAVKAVQDESKHMYENVRNLLLEVLNFHKKDLYTREDLESVIAQQKKIKKVDVDARYNEKIKEIYSAIIFFLAQSNVNWREEQSKILYWLKSANQDMVDAVKALKHLQKNLLKYHASTNPIIVEEYNQMRIMIILLLRDLEGCYQRSQQDIAKKDSFDFSGVLSLDVYKLRIEETEQQLSKRMYEHIRTNQITPQMAVSLINDSAYTITICRKLVGLAATLFVSGTAEQTQAERAVALEDSELENILKTEENSLSGGA